MAIGEEALGEGALGESGTTIATVTPDEKHIVEAAARDYDVQYVATRHVELA